MNDQFIFSSAANAVYHTGLQAFIQMGNPSEAPAKIIPEPNPTLINNITPYARWGDDNLFPQNIIAAAALSAELHSLLDWKSRAAQGKEVLPYIREYDKTTDTLKDKFCNDPEIIAFLNTRQFRHYIREAYNDFFWFWNVFPEMVKSQ